MSKTFVKITNQDIYEKLTCIEKRMGRLIGTTRWHTWAIGFIVAILVAVIARVI